MFSQTVEYSLRALVALAAQPDSPQTNGELAERTKVPAAYLSKVLQTLTKAGLVATHRGAGGGFSLRKPASRITILEAVNAVDPLTRIKSCPLGLAAHGKRLCPLHKKMDAAIADMEEAFGSTTLADLLAEPTTSVPLCDFPRAAARRG